MLVSMEDFFTGFVRNYHSFQVDLESNATKWTNKILGFYDQLGTLLGAIVEYEWNRYDLCWFWKNDKKPWLHVEHENGGSWSKLKDTLRKVNASECEDIIVIVYPETEDLWKKFLRALEKAQKGWTLETEVLAILDAWYFEDNVIRLEGHIFSRSAGNLVMKSVKKADETGLIYAILR